MEEFGFWDDKRMLPLCATAKKKKSLKFVLKIREHVVHTYIYVCLWNNQAYFMQEGKEMLNRKECYISKYSQFQDTGIYVQ